jgi:hypothetical protein
MSDMESDFHFFERQEQELLLAPGREEVASLGHTLKNTVPDNVTLLKYAKRVTRA